MATPTTRLTTRRDHALVLGASMAGLLAARVLSDHYARVTIIERDTLPTGPENRRGVPQGRHVHSLHPSGRAILEDLFPGIGERLRTDGAKELDNLDRFHLVFGGHRITAQSRPLPGVVQPSRPLLEAHVRARVLALPQVTVREHTSAVAPVATPDRGRITGLTVVDTAGGDPETIEADLVVDCSGRAAHGPVWLTQLGYERPPEEQVHVNLTYVSVQVRLPADHHVEDLVLVGQRPGQPRGMALFGYEGGVWTFTVSVLGVEPPAADYAAMVGFVEGIAPPHVQAALSAGEALTEPVAFKFPASRRRRYDKLDRLPEGYLPLGDAICSFNPIYGQGMSVAAFEAQALRQALAGGDRDLARRYLRAARRKLAAAWDLSVGSDLALPEVEGERTRRVRIINAWVDRVLTTTEHDPAVAEQFMRVVTMLDAPTALFRPGVVRRVMVRRRASAPAGQELAPAAGLAGAPAKLS
jgi:2-polyprenyl-6-methoxyphenol hydroxylase-like FAD-dependent oxidoreductase